MDPSAAWNRVPPHLGPGLPHGIKPLFSYLFLFFSWHNPHGQRSNPLHPPPPPSGVHPLLLHGLQEVQIFGLLGLRGNQSAGWSGATTTLSSLPSLPKKGSGFPGNGSTCRFLSLVRLRAIVCRVEAALLRTPGLLTLSISFPVGLFSSAADAKEGIPNLGFKPSFLLELLGPFIFYPGRHLDDTWVAHTGNGHNKVLCWQQVNSAVPRGSFGQSCTLIGNFLVLFGGINDNGDRLDDTWVGEILYEGEVDIRVAWRVLDVDSVAPPPRGAHAACATGDQRVVIHGGIGVSGLRLSDTWILDFSDGFRSGRQHKILNAYYSPPPPRSGHTLTWIGGTCMVLFGGRGSGYEVLNDVWLFSIHGNNPEWTDLTDTLSVLPSEMPLARVGHSASLVSGSKILINGGEDSQRNRKDDFWVLDAGALQRSKTAGSRKTSRNLWKKLEVEGHHPEYRSFHGVKLW